MDRYQLEQVINAQLDPGEGLLWSGAPSPERLALSALPAAVFGIPFTGFAAFWIYMAYTMTSRSPGLGGAWVLFPLFGLPFLLIGLGILTAPLWAYLGAGRTAYAVTNRRALIISRVLSINVKSFTHDEIHDLQHVERGDGSGDLYFASRAVPTRRGTLMQRIGFVGIPDVRSVEQLIRSRLQQDAA
ncbi:MAG TPA: hypothetical protein VGK89_14715 [Candidatus Eisenbacteria bacterium]|jgi:hypothetical protein